MKDLAERIAVITGAASGIGRACALALAGAGVRIVVADIDVAGANELAAAASGPERALAVGCDIGEPQTFEELKAAALAHFGRVEIVMNNAGVLSSGRPEELPLAEWQRVIDLNLMSVVRSNAAFLPLLIAQREGHIVNTASFAGLYSYAFDRLPYAASKAAVIQLSEGLALYLKPQGIGVTCLCPGPVQTGIMRGAKHFSSGLDMRGPGPQFGLLEPEAVGAMVVEAIRNDVFMLPTHPQVRELLIARASDWDAFLQRQIATPHVVRSAADAALPGRG